MKIVVYSKKYLLQGMDLGLILKQLKLVNVGSIY